jgi:DNA-binding transcriptional ArsR family regulator
MDVVKVGQVALLLLMPTLAVVAALNVPRGIRVVRRLAAKRKVDTIPQSSGPPIEQLAADLRRLLQEHERLRRSTGMAMRGRHLLALESAITDCATAAASALDLPVPDRPTHSGLAAPELRRLLRSLVDAGLVLPPAIGLLAADGNP